MNLFNIKICAYTPVGEFESNLDWVDEFEIKKFKDLLKSSSNTKSIELQYGDDTIIIPDELVKKSVFVIMCKKQEHIKNSKEQKDE